MNIQQPIPMVIPRASNMGYVVSVIIAIILSIIAAISNIPNESMSLAISITFLYIISQVVINNFIGEIYESKGTVLRPIVGTCSMFLLTWMAIAFFNIYFVPKMCDKRKKK